MLVDSGSTHSFIDEQVIHNTRYVVVYSPLLKITTIDGNYVVYHTSRARFSCKIEGNYYEDLRIIHLDGCEIVLRNDWMKRYNSTNFDHKNICVTIGRKGNKTVLHAILEEENLSMISGTAMGRLLNKVQTLMDHLFMLSVIIDYEQEEVKDPIQKALSQFEAIMRNQNPYLLLNIRLLNSPKPRDFPS